MELKLSFREIYMIIDILEFKKDSVLKDLNYLNKNRSLFSEELILYYDKYLNDIETLINNLENIK